MELLLRTNKYTVTYLCTEYRVVFLHISSSAHRAEVVGGPFDNHDKGQ